MANEKIRQEYQKMQAGDRNYLMDALSPEAKQQIEELVKNENHKT